MENFDTKTEKAILFLLKILKSGNGSLSPILGLGLNYSQIDVLLNKLVGLRYIDENNHNLSDLGLKYLQDLNKKYGRDKIKVFIEPYTQYKMNKIEKDAIFVPSMNELPKID